MIPWLPFLIRRKENEVPRYFGKHVNARGLDNRIRRLPVYDKSKYASRRLYNRYLQLKHDVIRHDAVKSHLLDKHERFKVLGALDFMLKFRHLHADQINDPHAASKQRALGLEVMTNTYHAKARQRRDRAHALRSHPI